MTRDELVHRVACELDMPSLYMSGPSLPSKRKAARIVDLLPETEQPKQTPLHELVDLCREQGLALDLSLYGPDEGQHPDSDDTHSTYLGGSRITGYKGDPMDVIRTAIRARRAAGKAS